MGSPLLLQVICTKLQYEIQVLFGTNLNPREAAVGVGGTGVVQGAQNTWVNMGGVEGKIGSRGSGGEVIISSTSTCWLIGSGL